MRALGEHDAFHKDLKERKPIEGGRRVVGKDDLAVSRVELKSGAIAGTLNLHGNWLCVGAADCGSPLSSPEDLAFEKMGSKSVG